jgi:hypothetical protein
MAETLQKKLCENLWLMKHRMDWDIGAELNEVAAAMSIVSRNAVNMRSDTIRRVPSRRLQVLPRRLFVLIQTQGRMGD